MPAACSRTWTPRAPRNSSSASRRATSKNRWRPARRAAFPTSKTDLLRRSGRVDERIGRHVEIVTELERVGGRDARHRLQLEQRSEHVAQPGVTLRRTDDEGHVAHAQAGVAALLAVGPGPTPVLTQGEC